jgi:hypothetical protein
VVFLVDHDIHCARHAAMDIAQPHVSEPELCFS